MHKVLVVVLIALVVFTAATEEEESRKPRHKKKHHKGPKIVSHKKTVDPTIPGRRCDSGFVEVANNFCCPKDHPVLIDATCYQHCDEGFDDLVLGAWVGCRERCTGGYRSSVNECTNGILTRDREDKPRSGVAPMAQKSLASLASTHVSACPKRYVRVKQQGRGLFKHGGCCPESQPKLVFGRCYGACEAGQDELTMGRLVACRAHCPATHTQHNNECVRGHEEPIVRGDFPRESSRPVDRIVVPKPAEPNNGCAEGFRRASKHYCCPTAHPVLKGLLCYAKCKTGYEEAAFGCRKSCPIGWDQSVLQCAKGGKSVQREGYERHPHPSKLRI